MQTRCNPKLNNQLIDRFKGHLQFRKLLGSLGLDSLLELKITRLQRELCADLARKIDVRRGLLVVNGSEIPLTYESLTKVIGLPCSGPCIPFRQDITAEDLLTIATRFNLHTSGRVSQYELWAHLDGIADTEAFNEEFKAKLLLFTIGTLLKPTTNTHMYFKDYIPMLKEMHNLCHYNWVKFVIDGLLEAVNVFQVRRAKSLGGCLLYLQVHIPERLCYRLQFGQVPRNCRD